MGDGEKDDEIEQHGYKLSIVGVTWLPRNPYVEVEVEDGVRSCPRWYRL